METQRLTKALIVALSCVSLLAIVLAVQRQSIGKPTPIRPVPNGYSLRVMESQYGKLQIMFNAETKRTYYHYSSTPPGESLWREILPAPDQSISWQLVQGHWREAGTPTLMLYNPEDGETFLLGGGWSQGFEWQPITGP